MRLYQQLVLFMLAATVLPLAVLGFWLLRGSEDALIARIGEGQQAQARLVSNEVSSTLLAAVDVLGRGTEAIDWSQATAEERRGGLALLYQQSELVSAVALVDAEGRLLEGPVFRAGAEGDADVRPAFTAEDTSRLLGAMPLGPLRGGEVGQAALGPAYGVAASRGVGAARMVLAVKAGEGRAAPFVLAELGLEAIQQSLGDIAGQHGGFAHVVDSGGRIVASSDAARLLTPLDAVSGPAVLGVGSSPRAFTVTTPSRQLWAAAQLPGDLGLFAAVGQPESAALAPVMAMRRSVLVTVGLAVGVLLVLGAVFTRRMNRRIARVIDGAKSYATGDLSVRIAVDGADELAELATTFNAMGSELENARGRLLRWNDDLRQKVEEATAELRAAQAQLVEAQKLAAVGQLGAGVAHEINNPLAGILGNAQLMMLERSETDPDFEMLKKIELSARRCKEITQNLLRFSQQRERPQPRRMDLNGVIRDALTLITSQLAAEGITLDLQLSEGELPVNGDPGHLQQVLLAVVQNARTAMAATKTKVLSVQTRSEADEVVMTVRDTGKGISAEHLPRVFEPFFTTKDVWSNVGLGLSVAYRVIAEHHGRIQVESRVGEGTEVMVCLPQVASRTSERTAA